jgi:hypothetical protein
MASPITRRSLAVLGLVVAASCGRARPAGQQQIAPLASMQPGWNRIAGGPHTTCALGTPYAFFVEVGDPQKLMIYFQGGGACWDATTCNIRGKFPYFKPAVGAREQPYRGGILDPVNPENPVRGFTKVYVPYCTADLHLGARTVAFDIPATPTDSARRFEIHHNGAANAAAALAWIYSHVPSPRMILVTGESAGSVPTPVYAAAVSNHYPRARVVQLGDGSGSYLNASGITTAWLALPVLRALNVFSGLDSATLTYPALTGLAARSSPRIAFAEINSAEDSTQSFFLRTADRSSPTVPVLLARNYAEIKRGVPAFRSYTVPGVMHTIIARPEFYTTSVDGVRLRDWVDALINGAPIRDVGLSLLAAK